MSMKLKDGDSVVVDWRPNAAMHDNFWNVLFSEVRNASTLRPMSLQLQCICV